MARTTETVEQRRERLIAVARDLIAHEGVAACTFRRLAAAAGTSTRPFTHAFGTRDNLLRAVALGTWSESPIDVHSAAAVIERPADWDCVEELLEIGEHWLPLDEERALAERVYVEIQLFALNHPELHEMLLGFSFAANAVMAQLIGEGQRRGQVRTDVAADDLVMSFWGLYDGLGLTGIYEPTALPPERLQRIWRDGLGRLLRP